MGAANGVTRPYASLCKVVLRKRQRNILTVTALAVYVCLVACTFDPLSLARSLLAPVRLSVLLGWAPLSFVACVPLVVLRKRSLSALCDTIHATRASRLGQLARSSVLVPALMAHLASALIVQAAYIAVAQSTAGATQTRDLKLGWLLENRGRDSVQLNERRVFLALLHSLAACYATVNYVLEQRSRVKFPLESVPPPIPARLRARLFSLEKDGVAVRAALSLARATTTSCVAYLLLRRTLARFVFVHVAPSFIRPHLYTLLKQTSSPWSFIFDFGLLYRAMASSLLLFVVWEATHAIFDVYASHLMVVSRFAAPHAAPSSRCRPENEALVAGLCDPEPYYSQLAYLELANISLTSPERRKSLFTDVRVLEGGSTAAAVRTSAAWYDVSRACLRLIGSQMHVAQGSKPTLGASGPADAATPSSPSNVTPVKTLPPSQSLFLPQKKTFIDALLASAPGTAAPAGSGAASATSTAVAKTTGAVERTTRPSNVVSGALRSVTPGAKPTSTTPAPPSSASSAGATRPPPGSSGKSWEEQIARWSPAKAAAWHKALFECRVECVVASYAPRQREVIWAIQGLSNMLCASLHEDVYGVAQRDIPKTLEAFVLYLDAIEAASARLSSMPGTSEEATRELGAIERALKDAVMAVLDEFDPYLDAFKFAPRVAAKLQTLADWGR